MWVSRKKWERLEERVQKVEAFSWDIKHLLDWRDVHQCDVQRMEYKFGPAINRILTYLNVEEYTEPQCTKLRKRKGETK